jgi:hypothetical protein
MFTRGPEREPLGAPERWSYVIFLAILLALFTAEVCYNYQPVKLTALFIVLFWVPLLALHEGGHAVVAYLLGWRVHRVVIGMGRTLGRFFVGRTPVEIRLVPVEGFVQPVPKNLRQVRLKSALIYFAGPGVELLLLVVVAAVAGPGNLLSASDDMGMLAAQSLCVTILAGAFFNLVPHQVSTPQGPVANDGLGIIRSFLLPESYFAQQIGLTYDADRDEWQSYDSADWWKRRDEED